MLHKATIRTWFTDDHVYGTQYLTLHAFKRKEQNPKITEKHKPMIVWVQVCLCLEDCESPCPS